MHWKFVKVQFIGIYTNLNNWTAKKMTVLNERINFSGVVDRGFKNFVLDCLVLDLDMTPYVNDFTVLATTSHIGGLWEREPDHNTLTWVGWLEPACHYSPEFQCDTIRVCRPPVQVPHASTSWWRGAPLNRCPQIPGTTWHTHLTFCTHVRSSMKWASRALNVMEDLAGSN